MGLMPVIARLWRMEKLGPALHYHHGPADRLRKDPVVCIVAHANQIAAAAGRGSPPATRVEMFPDSYRLLGLSDAAMQDVLEWAAKIGPQIVV